MKVLIITALFDIKRKENGDGRSIDDYLPWFSDTLGLKTDMVIYTEEKLEKVVLKRRKNSSNKTNVIVQKLEEIPFYKNNEKIKKIINSGSYKQSMKDVSRIECNLSEYNVIQYSKFGWLENASEIFPDYDYYFWMDAGCSRFFEDFNLTDEWPNVNKIDFNKITIQGNANFLRMFDNLNEEEYIWDNNCILVGTLFGANKQNLKILKESIDDIFNYYADKNCVNNEQFALAISAKRNLDLFNIIIKLDNTHLPLFRLLGDK